jgi:DNA gyrase/topoisomerase IV subunit A
VGMATNIPPHNLGELVDVLCALIKNPEATVSNLSSSYCFDGKILCIAHLTRLCGYLESSLQMLFNAMYILCALMGLITNITHLLYIYIFFLIYVKLQELLECMPGPDFPTGGIIMGNEGYASSCVFPLLLVCKRSNKVEF